MSRWNRGLNLSDAGCTFKPNVSYCGKFYFGEQPYVPQPGLAYPIRDGASPNCTQYTDAYVSGFRPDNSRNLLIAQYANAKVRTDALVRTS